MLLADEDRRVALGVPRRLGLAQRQHQVHEVGRLVALEDGHELLVVDPERVRRVVVDRLELVPDAHVLVHRALAVLLGQRVPRPHLHERVDDEVRRALRDDLPRPAGLVYCEAFVVARYEYGVSSQPASGVAFSAAPSSPRSS